MTARERPIQIDNFPVDLGGQSGPGQTGPDRTDDFRGRHPVGMLNLFPIGKPHGHHGAAYLMRRRRATDTEVIASSGFLDYRKAKTRAAARGLPDGNGDARKLQNPRYLRKMYPRQRVSQVIHISANHDFGPELRGGRAESNAAPASGDDGNDLCVGDAAFALERRVAIARPPRNSGPKS